MARIIRAVVPVLIAVVALAGGVHATESKYGAGVTLTEATTVKDLYASPEKFVGKKVRVDGVVTSVCDEMGCWLAIADAGNTDKAVKFQAEHDGAIVFPLTLKGRNASAEGVFTQISKDAKAFEDRYEIKVTGAVAP